MRNQDSIGRHGRYERNDFATIFIRQIEAVFPKKRVHLIVNLHIHGSEDIRDLRVADLVITLGIEINLIDGSTSGQNMNGHDSVPTRKLNEYFDKPPSP